MKKPLILYFSVYGSSKALAEEIARQTGGALCEIVPEIPYDIKKVVSAIEKRNKAGKRFTILAVAEGAISKEDAPFTWIRRICR